MIVDHSTLLNLTKIVVNSGENSPHGTFSSSIVLEQKTKKIIKIT